MNRQTLRKVQLVQLEIAREVKRICDVNQIKYFLDSGTLLGAVRHKGFIPWDDDLDLGMLREEYQKFLDIAPKALDSRYELVDWTKEINYPHQFCKVMKKGTLYQEEAQGGKARNGIYIDIFPYDSFPVESFRQKMLIFSLTACRSLIRAKCHHRTWVVHNKFHFKKWVRNLPFRILCLFMSKKSLIKKYEKIAMQYNGRPSSLLFPQSTCSFGKWIIPKNCLEKLMELKFEDTFFLVPTGYDEYLKRAYGDYMVLPPECERENRHAIIKVDFGNDC